jgi:formylglycine-generating enzyme required for sulfatase activity
MSKSFTYMKFKKIFVWLALSIAAIFSGFLIWNLDICLRIWQKVQDGNFTTETLRFELASFDIGKFSPNIPINTKISKMDGMQQVYVPEGIFSMGSNRNPQTNEYPQHSVYLDAFWMDKVEVTNAMYLKCLEANGCTSPVSDNIYYDKWVYRDHPMVYVTWDQANTYCLWANRRLPTEAEWEKAARGTDRRIYPWGNNAPTPRLANFSGTLIHESVSSFRYPLGASPYGVLNMSGNVREWIADWFDPNYYSHSPKANPKGPETGFERSLRSASYNEDGREIMVTNRFRHEPQSAGLSRGFRCAEGTQ